MPSSRDRSPQPEASVSIAHGPPACVSLRFCWSSSSQPRPPYAQAPVAYRLSFPEREHQLMQVEVDVRRRARRSAAAAHEPLVAGPLRAPRVREERLRRARSPTTQGKALTVTRPNPHQWDVTGHPAPCA